MNAEQEFHIRNFAGMHANIDEDIISEINNCKNKRQLWINGFIEGAKFTQETYKQHKKRFKTKRSK